LGHSFDIPLTDKQSHRHNFRTPNCADIALSNAMHNPDASKAQPDIPGDDTF
jgi:hypothetical protein